MVSLKGKINHKIKRKVKKYVPPTLAKKHSEKNVEHTETLDRFKWNNKLTTRQNYQAMGITSFNSNSALQKGNISFIDETQVSGLPNLQSVIKKSKTYLNQETTEIIEELYEKHGIDFEEWETDIKTNKLQFSAGECKKHFKNYLKCQIQSTKNLTEQEIQEINQLQEKLTTRLDENSLFVHSVQKKPEIQFGNIAELRKQMQ